MRGARTSGRTPDGSARAGDARRHSHAILGQVQRSADDNDQIRQIVGRAQANDDLAFAELYIRFFDRVHRYLSIALKNDDDAQEVAQDVFARALKRLDGYDPSRGDFRDWLFSMVRSVAIDHLRKEGRVQLVELDEAPNRADPVPHRAASLLERLDPESGARALIDRLPDTQRRVLTLRFVFGLDTAEIADVMASTPDAIRHAQHRALRALAPKMSGAGAAG
jgi:RNA polymerase sigma-70 factor (ECF subfamily)